MLLLPLAIIAAWAISLLDTAAWAPAALAILSASAALSWWQEGRGGKACASSSNAEVASSPEQTLQLIKSRRSVFPKDFSGEGPPRALLGNALYDQGALHMRAAGGWLRLQLECTVQLIGDASCTSCLRASHPGVCRLTAAMQCE